MVRAKVIEDVVPPEEVMANFANFYRLEALPSVLMEVRILCLDVSHSQLWDRALSPRQASMKKLNFSVLCEYGLQHFPLRKEIPTASWLNFTPWLSLAVVFAKQRITCPKNTPSVEVSTTLSS
jgi:hypothetical protein